MVRVYKRGKKWAIDFIEIDGRRVRKVVAFTKPVAQSVAAQVKSRIDRQRWGLPPGPDKKVSEFIGEFLTHARAEKAPKTSVWYSGKLRRFAGFIGKKSLRKVTQKDIENYKLERLGEVKAATVAGDIRAISLLFNRASKWGYIDIEKNPCRGVSRPRMIAQNPPEFLGKTEARKLLDTARGAKIYPAIATGLYTGMRVGEMLRLEWKDIDFERAVISVRSKEEGEGHTKSHKGRTIPIAPELMPILKKERRAKGYCFWRPDVIHPYRAYHEELRKITEKAGIKCGWHLLRHTHASFLAMAGVPLVAIKELLGHSDIKTTMIYAHLAPEHLRAAVDKLRF